jgi:hypothetical protein
VHGEYEYNAAGSIHTLVDLFFATDKPHNEHPVNNAILLDNYTYSFREIYIFE